MVINNGDQWSVMVRNDGDYWWWLIMVIYGD